MSIFRFCLNLFLACSLGLSNVGAQQFWSNASDDPIDYLPISDEKGRFYLDFDAVAFKNTLTESKGIKFLAEKDQVEMFLPNELGKEELFELDNVAVLSPDLQEKFPSIRTYVGKSRERPDVHIRLSYTPMGINAWILYPNGENRFLQPLINRQGRYVSYSRSKQIVKGGFNCSTSTKDSWKYHNLLKTNRKSLRKTNSRDIKTFRLAISTSGDILFWR